MSAFNASFAATLGLVAVRQGRYGTALAATALLVANLVWLLEG